jgi:6-phosphofructokinase 2
MRLSGSSPALERDSMPSIVTLTLSPTVDLSSVADRVRPIHKVRTREDRFDPGGGGINAARVIVALGGSVEAIALAGGTTGSLLDELLEREAVPRRLIRTSGATRMSHMVFERETGLEYRFVPEGSKPGAAELDACINAVRGTACEYFIASGSLPPGLPADIYARIGRIVVEQGARLVLDSSGKGLAYTLGHVPVLLIKPSLSELEGLVGHALRDAEAQERAARDIVRRGDAEIVALTLGADGAMLVTADTVLRREAPKVKASSAVGAGDSFVAAMTLALSHGQPPEAAFLAGIAAGAAAVLTPGTRLVRREDYERIHAELLRAE